MNSGGRFLSAMLLFCTLLAWPQARAEMIGVEQAWHGTPHDAQNRLLAALGREDVQRRLLQLGVDPRTVTARVAAMTDDEIMALGADRLPAAGQDWTDVLMIILMIVIAVAIYALALSSVAGL